MEGRNRTFLLKVSGSEVGGNVSHRKLISIVQQGSTNAVTAFLHGCVSKSREVEKDAACYAYLHRYSGNFKSVYGSTIGFYEHSLGS